MRPGTWDGYPGEDIILARRKGSAWYVGGMTNEEAREADFLVDFPEAGAWQATIWKDGPEADSNPTQVTKETMEIISGDRVNITMAMGGGFVMILEPLEALN